MNQMTTFSTVSLKKQQRKSSKLALDGKNLIQKRQKIIYESSCAHKLNSHTNKSISVNPFLEISSLYGMYLYNIVMGCESNSNKMCIRTTQISTFITDKSSKFIAPYVLSQMTAIFKLGEKSFCFLILFSLLL